MPEGMSADDFNVFARLVLQTDPEQVSQEMRTVVGSIFDSFEQSIPKMRKEGERMGAAQAEGVAAGYGKTAASSEKALKEALKRQQATREAYLKASIEQQRIALMRLSAAAAAADKAALEQQKDSNIRRHQAQVTFDRQYLQELDDTLKQGRRLENEALWKQLEADRIEHKLRLEQRRALDSKNLAVTKSFLADLARLEAAEYREGNRQATEAGQKRLAQERADLREGERLRKAAEARRATERKADLAEGARQAKAAAAVDLTIVRSGEQAKNQAARSAEARRLQDAKAAHGKSIQEAQIAGAKELQVARAAAREEQIAQQADESRSTARARAFFNVLTSTYKAGLRGVQTAWTAHFRKRDIELKGEQARELEVTKSGLNRQEQMLRSKLEERGSAYSRAGRRRLQQIESQSAAETRVITAASVRQAEAQAAIQKRSNTGVIGALSGRSSAGIGLQQIAAYAGGALILRSIASEATEAIKTQEQTAAVLKSTGGAANISAKQVDALANRLSVLAAVDDEAVAGAENLLLTFTNVRNIGKERIFDRATESILNMSVALKQDLKSSTIQLGKALNDPVKGITALSRVGVSFTKQQKDQIKVLVASGKTVEAQKIILRELQKEFGGSARAAATAGARIKVVANNIKEAIGLALYPAISNALGGLATLLQNVAFGQGQWKIIRDGLLGVALGLGAILAVKGAVEVLGLAGKALAVLASSPTLIAITAFATLSGVLFALVRNSAPVRDFFKSLVDGTKGWIEVGYKIGKPIDGLSRIVKLQSSLGATARIIHDFFKALVDGTIGWAKVGFKIGKPIEDLSRIVAIQSSLGAAARVIFNSLGKIRDAFGLLFKGNFGKAGEIVKSIIGDLGSALAPVGRAILDGLKAALGFAARGIGGFLQGAFGTGGLIGRLVGVTPVSEAAAAVGKKLRSVVALVASNAAGFISGIRGGDSLIEKIVAGGGEATASQKIGARIRSVVGSALSGAGAAFSALGSTIARLFTSYVLPKLIELPRILGRFLSRTLFSRQFLTILTRGAAGIGAVAAIISIQFVRGFAEGIYQRRNEIAGVIRDVLVFAVKTIFGSGNPFLLLSGLVVAAFASAKIIGALTSFSKNVKVAYGGASKSVSSFAGGVRKAGAAVNGWVDAIPFRVMKVGDSIKGLGDRVLKTTGLLTNSAGRLYKIDPTSGLASFVKDPTKEMSKFRVAVGQGMVRAGDSIRSFGLRASETFQGFKQNIRDKVGAGLTRLGDDFGGISKKAAVMASGVQIAGGAVAGYVSQMSSDVKTQVAGTITALGNVATAFSINPYLGAATLVATGVGMVFGAAQRKADEAKAKAKATAAAFKAAALDAQASFYGTFKEQGGSGANERSAAISDYLKKRTETNLGGIKQFLGKFKGSFAEAAAAAGRGTRQIQKYLDGLIDNQIKAVGSGGRDAMRNFAKEARAAAIDASDLANGLSRRITDGFAGRDVVKRTTDFAGALDSLNEKLTAGAISRDKYAKGLADLGFSESEVTRITKEFNKSLEAGMRASSGGTLITVIGGQLKKSIDQYRIFKQASDQANQDAERSGSFADKVSGAWGRIKDAISEATTKVRDFFDAQSGKERTALQLRSSLLSAAKSATDSGSGTSRQDRRLAVLNSAADTADLLTQLAQGAGSVEELQAKVDAYFADAGKGQGDKIRSYLAEVRKEITPEALKAAFSAIPVIPDVATLTQKLRDFLNTNNQDLLGKIDREKDPKKRLDLLRVALTQFQNENHSVAVTVKKAGGFDNVLGQIRADIGKTITIPVVIDPSFSQNGLNLFGTQILPPKRGLAVPPTRDPDGYAGKGNALGGYYTRQHISKIAEGGRPEAIFPLTNQPRMRQIAAIPQVRSALSAALPSPTNFGGSSPATVVNHEVNVEQTIVEAAHPRYTAAESVRGIRKAQFLGGATLNTVGAYA